MRSGSFFFFFFFEFRPESAVSAVSADSGRFRPIRPIPADTGRFRPESARIGSRRRASTPNRLASARVEETHVGSTWPDAAGRGPTRGQRRPHLRCRVRASQLIYHPWELHVSLSHSCMNLGTIFQLSALYAHSWDPGCPYPWNL